MSYLTHLKDNFRELSVHLCHGSWVQDVWYFSLVLLQFKPVQHYYAVLNQDQ